MGTTQRVMNQYQGRHDVFVGIDHRLKGVQRKDTLNQMWKEGYKVAVDEARSTCLWEGCCCGEKKVEKEARCKDRSGGNPFNLGLTKG